MGKIILTMVLWLIPYTADARSCTRPDQPSCLSWLGSADRFSFDSCRSEMVRYQQDVHDFIDCNRKVQNDVIEELNEAIQKFNSCARDKYC